MPAPRVLVLRAPGTNCDGETAFAFQQAGALPETVHLNRLLENPALPKQSQILCIPGGFSYGDDIAAGRIFANQMRHHLSETLAEFKAAGKLILGICNGFQVLIKSGVLLPDEADGSHPATLTWNSSGKFEDRWVHLAADGSRCVFLRGIESLYLPVAHAEGKFVTRDDATLRTLADAGQLVLRYTSGNSAADAPPQDSERLLARVQRATAAGGEVAYPANPNGSIANVAGICDATGRVFGLMPHPERHIDPTHHPRWTRGEANEQGDGLALFENAVAFFA